MDQRHLRLSETARMLTEIEDFAHIGNWQHQLATGTSVWSQGYYRILGLDPTEPPPAAEGLLTLVHPEDRETVRLAYERADDAGADIDIVYRVRRADGDERIVHERGRGETGPDGRIVRTYGTVQDVTDSWTAEDRLAELTWADPLTRLSNRHAAQRRLEELAAEGRTAALLHFDLVGFRLINSSAGLAVGDQVLRQVGDALRVIAEPRDLLARVGGDEFLLIRPDGDEDEAVALGSALHQAFGRRSWGVGDHEFVLSCRLGICVGPADPQRSLERAGTALAHSRFEGETTVWDAAMSDRMRHRAGFTGRFRRALGNGDLFLEYQPQCDSEGRLLGAEALVRWREGDRLIPPGDFLPLIEDTLLIHHLSDFVMHEVGRQIRRWREAGHAPPPVAVNVSPRQFADLHSTVAATAAAVIAENRLAPGDLQIEFTETSEMPLSTDQPEIEGLTALGVPLVVDDFGTGFSSLAALMALPIEKVKIDRSLVALATTHERTRVVIETTLWMAARLGIRCIAEGVENSEQLLVLRAAGCSEFQGFLFGRPIPPDEFTARWLDPSPRDDDSRS